MARWHIVQKSDLKTLGVYSSEESLLGTNQLGGPWNDSSKVMHLKVPSELEHLEDSELTAVHEQAVIAVSFEPCKCNEGNDVFREVYDKSGQLIVDKNGYPYYAQLYQKHEVIDWVYRLKQIGQ